MASNRGFTVLMPGKTGLMTGKTRLIAEVENQEFGKNPTYFPLFSALSRLR